MPKLKKKSKVEEVVAEVAETETAEAVEETEQEVAENINESEEQALTEQHETEMGETVQSDKLSKALKVVHDQFNLNGYTVTAFKDGGNKVEVAVSNGDFDLTIKVRDCDNYGIY